MRKLLSGLALVALVAAAAEAQPGGGNGRQGGGKAERQSERAERQGQRAGQQERRVERRAERQERRVERQQERRVERQAQRQERRVERQAERQQERRVERQQERRTERQVERQQERRVERQAQRQERQIERRLERQAERTERQADRLERRIERDARRIDRDGPIIEGSIAPRFSGRGRGLIEGCPPGLAKKGNGCMPPGLARQADADRAALAAAGGAGLLAATLSPDWFGYDDYGPDYRYYDGYLLRTSGDNVLGYVPLLGGALAPGRPWLPTWRPEPIPAYWTDYYGLGAIDRYRYYDSVIYELEPGYSEIDSIVALLAGDPWAVGSPMPFGYEVYNVPYAYRTRYYDTRDHWYRYADGYVYDIDPTTRLVLAVAQLLGGTPIVGQPWLASYRPAPIPPYWTDYYGLDRVDRYRYYDDVIFELDPGYGEIDAIVAVTAGDPWTVGSRMPYGYDIYNVPYSYRERYYDTADHWYRYSDGYIYDIDPTTRLVLAAVQLLA